MSPIRTSNKMLSTPAKAQTKKAKRIASASAKFFCVAFVVVIGVSSLVVAAHIQGSSFGDAALAQSADPPQAQVLRYQLALQAEVIDYFRQPAHIGAPGNRGWEYAPEPGQHVRAAAPGEVLFAGTVAANRFVTLLHPDGLRTTYGYLSQITVRKGEVVEAGHIVGTTSKRFFFSVRVGDSYIDPAHVFAVGRVRLVG